MDKSEKQILFVGQIERWVTHGVGQQNQYY